MLYYSTVESSTLELLKSLQELPSLKDTRLVGGTALSLQIGHRISIDLDFFGNIDTEPDLLIEELKTVGTPKTIKESRNIRIFSVNNIVCIDGLRMASIEDICAMKLAAITGRGTKKDFIDIYYLSKQYTLEQMLSFYAHKYPDGSEFIVLKSLSYFDDAEEEPMPYMLENIDWNTIKVAIENLL